MLLRRRRTDSAVARLSLAKQNEERVLAENALAGERLVAVVRLVSIVLISGSMGFAAHLLGTAATRDTWRGIGFTAYLVIAVGTFFILRRQKPDPHHAAWGPLALTLADFSWFTFAGWRSAQVDAFAPQAGAAVFALLIVFSVARFSVWHVIVSTGLACAGYMFLAMTFQPEQVRFHFMVLGVLMSLGTLVGLTRRRVRRMFLDLRRRDMLTRFLPRQIADRVITLGDTSLAPVQREVTVMFTDIRDFTTLSESMDPQAVLAFLDDYFGHMSHLVKAHDGIVNKFLGDGMLAFWGVPERLEDHAAHAMRAALDMRRMVEELNAARRQAGSPPIRIGIGIHTGTVAAGMLGGAEQHEYTVIGDAVNLASRIEGLTKQYGVDILVSQHTWELASGRFAGERIASAQVKGRAEPVVVYRLDGVAERAAAPARQPLPALAHAG